MGRPTVRAGLALRAVSLELTYQFVTLVIVPGGTPPLGQFPIWDGHETTRSHVPLKRRRKQRQTKAAVARWEFLARDLPFIHALQLRRLLYRPKRPRLSS